MEYDEKLLKRIQGVPGNNLCADCKEKDPEWVSFNIGVVICVRCSGAHRSLGSHISQVRSLKLDNWTEEQILKLEGSGNSKINEKLEFHVPKYIPKPAEYPDSDMLRKRYIQLKYETQAFKELKDDEEVRKLASQKEGYMLKMSKHDANKFQKRWLVLSEGALAYYRTSDSGTPLGVISIGKSALFSLPEKNTDICVSSSNRGREYVFRSTTNNGDEIIDWLFALRASISLDGRGSLVRRALSATLGFTEIEDDETPPGSIELCRDAFRVLSDGRKMKEGWLGKRTNLGVGFIWPKRYVILIPEGAIYYFRSPVSVGKWKEPLGAMSVVSANIERESQKPFGISIRCPEGQLMLSAEDEEERESWINALRAAADSHSLPGN